jgi:4-aminobutyrate aminotransferase
LMIGVEFVKDFEKREPAVALRDKIVELCFERGLLTLGCGKSVIRISPPLSINRVEMEEGLGNLDEAITKAENGVYPMIEEDIPVNSLIDN